MLPTKLGSVGSSGLRRRQGGDETPTHTLWVGNLPVETRDDDVMGVFSKYGALDCVTMHASRRAYAFVMFRHVDDARAAKDALQGFPIRGNIARIQFSRPAKAARYLWVGGISSSVTKKQLEDEFLKFGKIEEYQFFRDRNSAVIAYYKREDAIIALGNMNGKHVGGEHLCVDFQRTQPLKRDLLGYNVKNGHPATNGLGPIGRAGPPDGVRGFHDSLNRHMSLGGRREGCPSSVLWVGYPPSVQIDEQMLHNAMILYGEIERIRSFPSRHYSFVEFRSIDEARCAKEGLQDQLFKDHKIQLRYASSELALDPPPFPGINGPRSEFFSNGGSLGPLDLNHPSQPGHPSSLDTFRGSFIANSMPAPNMLMRPFRPQGSNPHQVGPEFGGIFHGFPGSSADKSSCITWPRRSASVSGILPSSPGLELPIRSMPGVWDRSDMRETKRSRVCGSSSDVCPYNERLGIEYSGGPVGFPHSDRVVSSQRHSSPVVLGQGELWQSPDHDYCWRGIIAKCGNHVCRARCVPIGKGIDSPLPKVVNCSARTGLDMLAKHYSEADGFDIVCFQPDSEEDFPSYTEFLNYMILNSRAGVAKLDDGTTLFFVPPSNFLTEVLKVSASKRLYGVVLNFPQQSSSAALQQPQLALPSSRYNELQDAPSSQKVHGFVSYNEEQPLKFDYSRSWLEDHAEMGRSWGTHGDEAHAAQSVPIGGANNRAAASQVEISLTPELISTLASLIPQNIQSSATGAVQKPPSPAVRTTSSSTSVMHDMSVPFQGGNQDYHAKVSGTFLEQPSYPSEHLAWQFINQASNISHFPTYLNASNRQDQFAQPVGSGGQIQDSTLNLGQPPAAYLNILSRQDQSQSDQPIISGGQIQNSALNLGQPLAIPSGVLPYQVGQVSINQSNQQCQLDSSLASQNNYDITQATNAAGVFNPAVQQQLNPTLQSAHNQIGSLPQHQNLMPLPPNKGNMEFISQGQELQPILSGSTQGNSEGDADKNERYQTTLQFAANLLLQMQQQKQLDAKSAQGSGRQQ